MLSRRKSAPFLRDGKANTNAAVLLLLELKKGFDIIKTQSFQTTGKTLVAAKVDGFPLSTPLYKSANVFGPAFPVTLTTRNRGDTERALGQTMSVSSLSILSPSATQPDLTGPACGRSMANTFSSPLP